MKPRAARSLLALCLLTLSACMHTTPRAVPGPKFPETISATERDQLFAAHALVCASNECTRGDGKYELRALGPNGYPAARQVLVEHGEFETSVTAAAWTITIASLLTATGLIVTSAGYDPGYNPYVSQRDAETASRLRNAGFVMYGVSAVAIIASLLLPSLLGGPDEAFETAYNEALAADLDARVVAGGDRDP